VKPVVVDCSLAMTWFFPEEGNEKSDAVLKCIESREIIPVAPELFLAECGNVFWKKTKAGHCTYAEATHQLKKLLRLPLRFFNNRALITQALSLAHQENNSVNDSLYLALSMELQAPLATLDQKLALAALKHQLLYSF
jgi:predicted nucleic acid-binding protein